MNRPLSTIWNDTILPHIPHIIKHDFWRKLFAVFFAVLITWYSHENIRSKIEFKTFRFDNVPIKLIPPDGIEMTPVTKTVSIEVNASAATNLKQSDFFLEYPVSLEQIEQDRPVSFTPSMIRCTRKIENLVMEKVYPEDPVSLDMDYFDSRIIPVSVSYSKSELLAGYEVTVNPPEEQVTIRGPRKKLATMESVQTEKIPLANVTNSFSRIVALHSTYNNIDINPGTVKIKVDIVKMKKPVRTFEQIPVQILAGTSINHLSIVKIMPEEVTVQLEDASELSPSHIHPFIDISNVNLPGVYTIDIKCWTDHNSSQFLGCIPAQSTVTLEAASPPSSSFVALPSPADAPLPLPESEP